jgi:hypothetical protein
MRQTQIVNDNHIGRDILREALGEKYDLVSPNEGIDTEFFQQQLDCSFLEVRLAYALNSERIERRRKASADLRSVLKLTITYKKRTTETFLPLATT